MADDDDLDWITAVGGRARPGADPDTLHEASLLRTAARRWTPRPLPADALRPDDAEALLARARREGALGRRGWCAGCVERWRATWRALSAWPWAGSGIGMAVAALLAVLVFGLLPPRDDGAPVQRGALADGVWLLRSEAPQVERDRIADELAAAGLKVRRYERLGRHGLDAELPAASAAAAEPALRRLGVQPGPDGVLRIEVEKAAP